jgi:hypothetical protein
MEAFMCQPSQHRSLSPSGTPGGPWSALGIVLLVALAPAALAQHPGGRAGGRPNMHLDRRFGHNQYYFNRGFTVRRPPPGRQIMGRNGSRFWYSGGNWYRWRGGSWVVGAAPAGLSVPVLPPFHSTIWSGGVPYYYANDSYYRWDDAQQGYQVVVPPQGIESQATTLPPGSNQLFVYPRNGQSDEQQRQDRFECHRWAIEQTGFDPTVAGGGVPQGEASDQRDRYSRAEVACLEARGYSVE